MNSGTYTLIDHVAQSLHSALIRDLPDIEYETVDLDPKNKKPLQERPKVKATRRPDHRDIKNVVTFQQAFTNGSGLFGGVSTCGSTDHTMVAVFCKGKVALYHPKKEKVSVIRKALDRIRPR